MFFSLEGGMELSLHVLHVTDTSACLRTRGSPQWGICGTPDLAGSGPNVQSCPYRCPDLRSVSSPLLAPPLPNVPKVKTWHIMTRPVSLNSWTSSMWVRSPWRKWPSRTWMTTSGSPSWRRCAPNLVRWKRWRFCSTRKHASTWAWPASFSPTPGVLRTPSSTCTTLPWWATSSTHSWTSEVLPCQPARFCFVSNLHRHMLLLCCLHDIIPLCCPTGDVNPATVQFISGQPF